MSHSHTAALAIVAFVCFHFFHDSFEILTMAICTRCSFQVWFLKLTLQLPNSHFRLFFRWPICFPIRIDGWKRNEINLLVHAIDTEIWFYFIISIGRVELMTDVHVWTADSEYTIHSSVYFCACQNVKKYYWNRAWRFAWSVSRAGLTHVPCVFIVFQFE